MRISQFRVWLTAGVLAAALPVGASAAPLVLFDGTFNNADWDYTNQSTGLMVTASAQALTGGNLDENRQTTVVHPPYAGAAGDLITLNINNTFQYDPGTHGAITNLQISFDVRTLSWQSTPGASGAFFMGLLEQGGNYYRTNADILSSASWSSFVLDASNASSWDLAGPANGAPNFSATGGPIRFGYRIGTRYICNSNDPAEPCAAIDGLVALDNFRVSVTGTPVPEPVTLVLLGTGLACVVARRRA